MHSSSHRPFRPTAQAVLITLLAVTLALVGCGKSTKVEAPAPKPLEVSVLVVAPESVALTRELPGRSSAFRVAEVRARVSGVINKRCFTEGSDVREGELLFEIDAAPYEAALDSAKATLARAEANFAASGALADRYKGLVETNAISRQAYDDAVATHLAHQADVLAGRAAVRNAEINLAYTRVSSPISGRIGRAAVTEGAYVQQGAATLLATVQQLDPLYIDLSQSAEEVLRLKQALASGRLLQAGEGAAKFFLTLGEGRDYGITGSLQFSDVSVNTGTGTVLLRGTIPNPRLDLLPGLFVRVRLEEGRNPAALLVPQSAVRRNAKGEGTVLVIGAEGKVELRVIEATDTVGNRWVVSTGLKAGDQVILDNLQKIRPGMPVKAAQAGAAPAPSGPAAGSTAPAAAAPAKTEGR